MKRFLSALLCAILILSLLPSVSPPARMVGGYTLNVSPAAIFVGEKIRAEVTDIEYGSGKYIYAFQLHRYTANGWEYASGDTIYHPENVRYLTPAEPGVYRVYSEVRDEDTSTSFVWSGDIPVTLRPSVRITKVEALGGTSLKLTWGKVAGATGYEVHRSASKTGPFELVRSTTALSFTNTYLTPGKQYFYKVRAYNTVDGIPIASGNFSAIRAGVPLAKPTITGAVGISTTQINLSWTKVTGATGYQILRSTSAAGTYQSIKLTTALTYTVGGLQSGKIYYFKVRPYKKISTLTYYGPLSAYKAGRTR